MGKKILVVDDSPDLLDGMARNLRKAGYSVFTARNGEEALRRAQQVVPDLVMLDLLLPDVDGYSVCESLRRSPATAAVQVVMITGMPGELPRYAGFDAGAVGFLRKPFGVSDLINSVREALNPPSGGSGEPKHPSASESHPSRNSATEPLPD